MLKQHEVNWIKQLAKRGMTCHAIAFQTGYTRDTVRKILEGQRPENPVLPAVREQEDEPLFSGPLERCPACGARVYMPCMACRVRAFQEVERLTRDIAAAAVRGRRRKRAAGTLRRCA